MFPGCTHLRCLQCHDKTFHDWIKQDKIQLKRLQEAKRLNEDQKDGEEEIVEEGGCAGGGWKRCFRCCSR